MVTTYNNALHGWIIYADNEVFYADSQAYYVDGAVVMIDVSSGSATYYDSIGGPGVRCSNTTYKCSNNDLSTAGSVVITKEAYS